MPKLRIGIGEIPDARPLAWGFLKGHHADLFAPVSQPAALVARLLAQGDLDAGLVPPVEAVQGGLAILPDLCVAHSGPARSLLVVSASPLPEVRRVYIGRHGRGSAVVLRTALAGSGAARPELVAEEPSEGPAGLGPGEAVVLAGGAALLSVEGTGESAPRTVLDLGAAWQERTGTPLVTAVWAVRDGVSLPDLPFYFKSSLRYGLSSLDAIARETAAELAIVSDVVAAHLRGNVGFFLQDEERRGLDELVRRAVAQGALPEGAQVRYWP